MSFNWRDRCKGKLTTAEKAIALICRGDNIYVSAGSAAPLGLYAALVDEKSPAYDNVFYHLLTLGDSPYVRPEYARRFRHCAFFMGGNVRTAVNEGRADCMSVFLHEIPDLIRSRQVPMDTMLISVTPPNEEGYCSYGTHIDLAPSALEVARTVIAEVNLQMPWTNGPSRIHVDQIDAMVEVDHPLPHLVYSKITPEFEAMGRHIVDLIPDGATLQMGIGGVPDGVLHFLHERNDLGIHTEMFSEGVINLVRKGNINCKRKSLHPGKMVASFLMGTQRLYDFIKDNPMVELYPVDYTNDPKVIAQNDRMVAINTALEVDLTGQVCSDSIGTRFYSGFGGQVDFIRGAAQSKGGVPIIALESTAKNGEISRIVPTLKEGAGVVTSRADVHWVVTEYGAVYLHGKNMQQRAMALISIAHPKFRQELLDKAKARKVVFVDQPMPSVYPKHMETKAKTEHDVSYLIRPVRVTDESLIRRMFYQLSPNTICSRFFATKGSPSMEMLRRWCAVDYEKEFVLVASQSDGPIERLLGWGSYTLDEKTQLAEVSVLVADEFQNQGIGTAIMQSLILIARDKKFKGITAEIMPDNQRMLKIFEECGYPAKTTRSEGTVAVRIDFPA